jgi:hypothetical protein
MIERTSTKFPTTQSDALPQKSKLKTLYARFFHGRFYGRRIFGCKTAQFCDTLCKVDLLGTPLKSTLRNAAKTYATR